MLHKITTPIDKKTLVSLKAGDEVCITGTIYTARDSAHKLIYEMMQKGKKPPIDLKNSVIYYAGPTPAAPGKQIGSVGPTTAGRMDKYTPFLIKKGLRAMIGKGSRSDDVIAAIKKHKAVYLACVGGAAGYLAKCVKKSEFVAFGHLGPEAIYKLEVEDFPTVVVHDKSGGDFYEEAAEKWSRS